MSRIEHLENLMEKLIQSQSKTDAQLAKTDAQLAKTHAQFAKNNAQFAKTDTQLSKTDAQMAKTDAKLKETRDMLHGIGVNLGSVSEEFFFDALKSNMKLGEIKYDSIAANVTSSKKNITDEFDIVLYNGNSIALIETKHKVHPIDVDKLIQKKLPNFRTLFPQYKNHDIYLGLAGFSIHHDIVQDALQKGVIVLKQKSEVLQIKAENSKPF